MHVDYAIVRERGQEKYLKCERELNFCTGGLKFWKKWFSKHYGEMSIGRMCDVFTRK